MADLDAEFDAAMFRDLAIHVSRMKKPVAMIHPDTPREKVSATILELSRLQPAINTAMEIKTNDLIIEPGEIYFVDLAEFYKPFWPMPIVP